MSNKSATKRLPPRSSAQAGRLLRSAGLLEQAIQDLDEKLGRLLAPKINVQRERLSPLLVEVEALDGLCDALRLRVAAAATEMEARRRDNDDYIPSATVLAEAKRDVDAARSLMANLSEDLELPSTPTELSET